MSELNENELIARLLKQEKILSLVVAEAEAKVVEYTKALKDGRNWLKRIEDLLATIYKKRGKGEN
jgi:hypothetical protein